MHLHPEIRRAEHRDLTAIESIERRCFADDAFTRRQLAYLITQAKGVCFVACDGQIPVAYISLLERTHLGMLRIYSVAVDPSAQGRGLGQQLIDRTLAYAEERSIRTITLEVRTDNTAALTLYEKNGFGCKQLLRGYYHDGADAWRMTRDCAQEQTNSIIDKSFRAKDK